MLINGQMYDWSSVELGIAGAPVPSFTAIEYEDSQDVKKVYGKGRKAVGFSKGNYDASGKVTLHREAYDLLELAVPALALALGAIGVTSLYDLPPVPLLVSYGNRDKPLIKDMLKGVKFTKRKTGMSQNDDAATVELEMDITEIAWNGRTIKG